LASPPGRFSVPCGTSRRSDSELLLQCATDDDFIRRLRCDITVAQVREQMHALFAAGPEPEMVERVRGEAR